MLKLLPVLVLLVGCGGVSADGEVDEHGCPTQMSDFSGTAVTSPPACTPTSETISIVDGTFDGKPVLQPSAVSYDPGSGMCTVSFAISFDNGCDAGYRLEMPAR